LLLLLFRAVKLGQDAAKGKKPEWQTLTVKYLTDPTNFWGPTLIAIGAAVGAMLQVYDGDVAWGADFLSAALALAGTALSAAGLGTFLSSIRGNGGGR
jgi:hypothetical protein